MEEIKDRVIVIKSTAFKEKDKLVSLFSLSGGLIKAKLTGVLKPNAKLKFLTQPFCFAEVELVKKGDFFTVKSAYPLESFYGITCDLEKFKIGSAILEVLGTFSLSESSYPEVFISALKAFEFLEFGSENPKPILVKFMLDVFARAGYGFVFDKCSECGGKILTQAYFDFDTGSVLCLACKNASSVKVGNEVISSLNIISRENFDNLKTIKFKDNVLDEILSLFKKAYYLKFGINLKSF